ncbi:hypothetical protein SynROS8604_00743 [Synechococcus sp. ROS8604]|nr:hypothetical protein SynROS8604_00743 [Synechococcus sp. ROS8604]
MLLRWLMHNWARADSRSSDTLPRLSHDQSAAEVLSLMSDVIKHRVY